MQGEQAFVLGLRILFPGSHRTVFARVTYQSHLGPFQL